jgi:hypothetical protein
MIFGQYIGGVVRRRLRRADKRFYTPLFGDPAVLQRHPGPQREDLETETATTGDSSPRADGTAQLAGEHDSHHHQNDGEDGSQPGAEDSRARSSKT